MAKEDEKAENSDEKEKKEIRTSFFKEDGFYFEQILTEKKKVGFAMYNPSTDEVKLIPEYETPDYIFKPIEAQEVYEGYIYLPSKTEEYDSDEKLEEDLKTFIRKWLDIPEDFLQYCVWEIKQSWIYDKLNTINYLRFLGDLGQGKTRALTVVGFLHYKPIKTSGASTVAPIFRIAHKWKGTFLIDEFDLKKSDETADFIKFINLGFERHNPIMRCDQNKFDDIKFFDPYCPKIMATRKPITDKATESRCFTHIMEGTERTDIPLVLDDRFYKGAQHLRNKLLLWRFRNYGKIKVENTEDVDLGELEPRIKQTHLGLVPLFRDEPKKWEFFKEYLQKLQKRIVNERMSSFEYLIIKAFCELVFELGYKDVIPKDLIVQGNFIDFSKSPEEPMEPRKLSKWLKGLGLGEREDAKLVDRKTITPIKFTKEQLKKLAKKYGFDIKNEYKLI